MAKNTNYVSHKKSKTKIEGKPKLPLASSLVEGEIAVNFAENVETLSIKNESGTVVAFSSDNYYTQQKLGSGFTGANSAVTVTEALENIEIDVDQVIDSGTSASTNAVATKAVYEVITNIEDIVGSGYTSSSITDVIESRDQAIAAALNYLNSKGVASAVTVSSNLNNVVCPSQILGNEMSGAQAAVVYVNSGTTTDYTITVSTTYKTPDGNQLNLTCPKNGYCEINYLNINGTIYARGI